MFAIVLAALDRSGSVLPILCAMVVHELAHVVMMLACGGQVRRLTLRFADFQIAASGLGYRQELLSALAGPLVNLICGAAFCMQRPSFAAYSLMLGIYNLLPVWPLDGGRMLWLALCWRTDPFLADRMAGGVSLAAAGLLTAAGAALAGRSPFLLMTAVCLLCCTAGPCIKRRKSVYASGKREASA